MNKIVHRKPPKDRTPEELDRLLSYLYDRQFRADDDESLSWTFRHMLVVRGDIMDYTIEYLSSCSALPSYQSLDIHHLPGGSMGHQTVEPTGLIRQEGGFWSYIGAEPILPIQPYTFDVVDEV